MSNALSKQILQLGHPILRQYARTVDDIGDTNIQTLIENMLKIVIDAEGMGLAAPQISHSLQIFIMASHPNSRYPHAPRLPATAVINPQIIWQSKQIVQDWEGCLSVPKLRGYVPRAETIRVRYRSQKNILIETEYTGFLARIFQHEYDHLIAKLFIDRIQSNQDLISEQEWRSQILGERHE
jgi:peptide deformylase